MKNESLMSKSGWFPTIEMMPYRFAGIRMQRYASKSITGTRPML